VTSRPNKTQKTGPSPAPADPLTAKIRAEHKKSHPNCTFGDQPHFIPPGAGMIGFYECDPPADLTNHTRCMPPYDHEHADHRTDPQYLAFHAKQRAERDTEFDKNVAIIANILRTHQYDEGVGDKYPGRCFCGNQMGDQENHQAIAIVEAGWKPPRGATPVPDPDMISVRLNMMLASRVMKGITVQVPTGMVPEHMVAFVRAHDPVPLFAYWPTVDGDRIVYVVPTQHLYAGDKAATIIRQMFTLDTPERLADIPALLKGWGIDG
jgi:hypothetical protein